MSHTEYSVQFVQYSSVFLGLEEAPQAENGWSLRHKQTRAKQSRKLML
jgi:hypothetical protein